MVTPAVYRGVLKYFHYWPSRDMAIVAMSLYILAALTVLFMTVRTRAWYMLIAVVVALLEMGGFACRISMFNKPQYGVFVAMQCLLIIPPSFIALVQYLTIGKVLKAVQQARPTVTLKVKPTAFVWIYFGLEIASLSLQGAGAGLSVSDKGINPHAKLGKALLLLGLATLVALMLSFLIMAVFLNFSKAYGVRSSPSLRKLFCALYVSTALLLARNIFRLIEFSGGWYSKYSHEVYFYPLDTLLILLIFAVFTFFHFGLYFNGFAREQDLKGAVAEEDFTNGFGKQRQAVQMHEYLP